MTKPPVKGPAESDRVSVASNNVSHLPSAKTRAVPAKPEPMAPVGEASWHLSDVPDNFKEMFWKEVFFQFKANHRMKLIAVSIKLSCAALAVLIVAGLAVLLSWKLFGFTSSGLLGASAMLVSLGGILYVFRRVILVFLLGDNGGKL